MKPRVDPYQLYRDALIDEAIAETMYREVKSWTGSLADSFWDADDDDVPPWAKPKEPQR
jgi:hypothetical protein